MADKKITQLTNITGANLAEADEFVVVDITADETKAITFSELKTAFDTGTGFVRITGDTMTGNLSFGDNDKAIFGAGSDLQIYHDGAHSYITDVGQGDLRISGGSLVDIQCGSDIMFRATEGGATQLRYDGSLKLKTTSTGIDVTGTVTADGLTVDGDITLTAGDKLKFNDDRYFTPENNVDGAEVSANGIFRVKTGATPAQRLLVGANGDISFYEDTGTTAKFFWDASAERLGLGTSSPSSQVHISSSIGATLRLERDDTTITSNNIYGNISFTGNDASSGASGARANIVVLAEGDLGQAALTFKTAGSGTASTERMRIDSSGNVGIGTSSPSDKLEVLDGALMLKSSSASGYPNLKFENGSRRYDVQIDGATQALRIVDNTASAERMRIDSSGNLLVGKTGTSVADTGVQWLPNGNSAITRSSGVALFLNRTSSDGSIVDFRKDNTSVGSIGTTGGDLYIATGDTGIRFDDSVDQIRASTSAGLNRDGAIDIGFTDSRFKDLHLSGGVYLGGTGSANKLDDYEEGNFTPFLDNATGGNTATYGNVYGNYVKVGDLIYCQFRIPITAKGGGSGNIRIGGLPFAANAPVDFMGGNSDLFYTNAVTNWVNLKAGVRSSNTQLYVFGQTSATNNVIREGNFTSSNINSNFELRGSVAYRVS